MPIFVFYSSESPGKFAALAVIVAESRESAAVIFRRDYNYSGRIYIAAANHFDSFQLSPV